MSVQLIVFPQSHDGQFSSISTTANEFVVDGINFNSINTSSSYDSSATNVILDVLTNQPPSPFNTWFRFRSTSFGTPTLPTETAGNLILNSTTTFTFSGVYQKLSSLVVGTTYQMTVDLSTTGTGQLFTGAFNGTNVILQPANSASQSQIIFSWTAASAEDTLVISYLNSVADDITISNISVSQQGITPTSILTDLQDGQVICDLYEDEDIPLSLSVDDFKNVAEKVQSYSKAFNLPATKRNNQIFDNIFEITRTDTGLNFNPYKRTKAILKQDGFLLFEGYLRLLDISDKSGETSYNVNLYSEVVALADVLGDKTFSELDFTELEHDYNKTNITRSWNDAPAVGITYTNASTSGFRDANSTVKYPFVDWTHQILVGGSTGSGATDGFPELTNLETCFRPFINIKYLIDRIFEVVPFTYESDFFNTEDFKKLYMDFNWGGDIIPETGTGTYGTGDPLNTSTGGIFQSLFIFDNDFPSNAGYDTSTHKFTAAYDNQTYIIDTDFFVTNLNNSADLEFAWFHKDAAGNTIDSNTTSPFFGGSGPAVIGYSITLYLTLNQNDTLEFKYYSTAGNSQQFTSNLTVSTGYAIATTNVLLQTLRGELSQWKFLKGIMTMFNLVTLPDEDNPSNIKIEPYSDVFLNNPNSVELDWTEKIDVSEMKLMPLTDLNKKTIFKFVEDDDDYCFRQYKRGTNHLYGSKKYDASEFTILAGEDEIIAEPFAATLVKPLMTQFSDFITPAVYAMSDDGAEEGFDNSPRIMFNNGIKSNTDGNFVSCTYYMPAQNGVTSSNADAFLQFSHLTDVPTIQATPTVAGSSDFHFGECQLMLNVGNPVNNNLFNLYWLPYYSELYNPDTRIMTIKVNLSPSDINTFKFNDTVFIKNRTFRVNKIDYKPNDLATVEFILIP